MNFVRRLLSLFDRPERLKLAGISALLFFGSLLEVAGIGLILPFIKIVSAPALLLEEPRIGPWLHYWRIDSSRSVIIVACVTLLIVTLLKGFYVLLAMRWSYKFTYDKVLSLQRRVLECYLHAPYLFHLNQTTARLVKDATLEPEAVGGVLKFALFLPAECIVVIGLMILLAITQPGAALMGIMALGLLMWAIGARSRKELSVLGSLRQSQHIQMIKCVHQSLGGIKEVKLLGREKFFADSLLEAGRQYTRALYRSTLLTQSPRVILETSAALLIVLFVLLVIFTGRNMEEVVGVLAVFGMAVVRLVPSATRITNALQTLRFYSPSVTAVAQAIHSEVQPPAQLLQDRHFAFTTEIQIESLGYRYSGSEDDSLSGVSLRIPRGSRVAFAGTSGAGKTTLVNLILGLLQPTSGQIRVDGLDIRQNLRAWQRRLGYIPQDIFLIDDTIRRNVAFGLPDEEINDEAVWKALEEAQLAGFVRESTAGLETQVGERGVRISAGQRQRIGIARALYNNPDVLVLDEATSALDNETERLFVTSVHNLLRNKTLLVIAHRLRTVLDCDIIYFMDKGKILAQGSFEELLMKSEAFAQLVRAAESTATIEKAS